jgi:NADH-quinone oxidoreductase subunit J
MISDVLIGVFGVMAIIFALLVVVLRQPMRAALALIAHMVSLAAIFACLQVHVVALFQILIYVGAVMVFMVYAIMLLDDRDTSYTHMLSRWTVPAVIVAAVLLVALGATVIQWMPAAAAAATIEGPAPFSFSAFSLEFMRRYWFHFEVASILLVVGIVAAWTVIAERR